MDFIKVDDRYYKYNHKIVEEKKQKSELQLILSDPIDRKISSLQLKPSRFRGYLPIYLRMLASNSLLVQFTFLTLDLLGNLTAILLLRSLYY